MSTEEIGNTQEILDYIAYCLKQKKYICEIPSKEYNNWKSMFIRKEDLKKLTEEVNKAPVMPIPLEEKGYIATYHGIPIKELQKAYFIYKWIDCNNVSIRTPHGEHKISNEEREEAIKRAIAQAYLFYKDKNDKK